MSRATLPTGIVTFLFTDIEGSTRLWEEHSETMGGALHRHDVLLREAIEANNGHVFKTVGDAFCAAFPTAIDALSATLSAHRALQAEEWGEIEALKIRVGLHTGIAQERDGDYFGPTLNRVARIQSAGHGQQTLLSTSTYELVRDHLPDGACLLDLGEHRLKDLLRPERLYQLAATGLPSQFPPIKTLDTRANNLPRQATALIGREKETDTVCSLLRKRDTALLTLTGPGGTGKTRLGLQVAADLLDDFPDGVWFVELSPLTEPRLVVPTIAQTLGVKEAAGQLPLDTLKAYLKEKEMLLLLDNFEQVTGAAGDVSQLLAASAGLKVLATSRVPLRIRGEKEYAVSPLELPDMKHLPPLERLTQCESVRLFIERATDVKGDFQVTNENAPSVAEICIRLDGLPLAIELAAARIKMLPPHYLLARLSQRLKFLTGGARDLTARQQTLRGAIDWSYNLLDDAHKQFFRRMAVFNGGRTLEALEAVCNSEGLQLYGKLEVDVFDGAEMLLCSNMLQQREGSDGEPRLWMLETIHEYAREKLEESGEREILEREHALYFMRVAEEAEPYLTGAKEQEWLNRLEDEHANLRSAFKWVREEGEKGDSEAIDIGLRTAGAMWRFWYVRGYFSEGREQLQGLLSASSAISTDDPFGSSTESKAKALVALGALAYQQGDYIAARATLEQALSAGRDAGDKKSVARALSTLAVVSYQQGDYATSRSLNEQSLALQRELGNKWGTALSLNNLGYLSYQQGDYSAARSLHEESLALQRELGNKSGVAYSLGNLGMVSYVQGDYSKARSLHEESLAIRRELGDKSGIAHTLSNLGIVSYVQGDYPAAMSMHEESLAIKRELGDKSGIAYSLGNLGMISFTQGGYPAARSLHEESLALHREIGDKKGIAVSLAGLGEVASETGQPRKGAALLGASQAVLEAIGAVMAPEDLIPYERAVASAAAQSGEEEFEKAWQVGRAMSIEEAIAYAIETP
jgi:predicted ATPase/class 3 adenylate cyclase/Tfp pilus assembly protein PilF